ncbi:MAG: hypothetical protein AAFN18_22425 [Cyanobacteria bacterium J06554_6]
MESTSQRFVGSATGIAIALPTNWQSKVLSQPPERAELYYSLPLQKHSPQIIVQTIPVPPAEHHSGSYHELANSLILEQQQASLNGSIREIDQRETVIDGHAARVDVFSYIDPASETSVLQYQICIQMTEAVGAIVGLVTAAEMMQCLPIFETAENSLELSH